MNHNVSLARHASPEAAAPISLAIRIRKCAPEFDAIFEGTDEQVSIHDLCDRYLYANRAVLDSFGEGLARVLGRTWQEVGSGGETAEALQSARAKVLESGAPVSGTLKLLTERGEETVNYTVSPVVSGAGGVEGTTTISKSESSDPGVLSDADAALRYRLLLEHATEGVIFADGPLSAMNATAERTLGVSIDDLQWRGFDDPRWLAVRADGTAFPLGDHPLSVARATGEPVIDAVVGVFNPTTRTNHWLAVSAIPVVAPDDGQDCGLTLVTFNDVTNARLAADEQRQQRIHVEQRAVEHEAALYKVKGRLEEELEAHAAADATVRRGLTGALRALAQVSEMRDMYTAGHQDRVAGLAVALALELEWPLDQRRFVSIAASVHDIGKMIVPSEILSKPSTLTPNEYELVKDHPEAGASILRSIEFAWPVAEVVAQHHERIDGSGYPLGLRGDEIRPEAKVIAVADVVEAISSHRPYRPAYPVVVALDEIRAGRGTLYDADAVDACIRVFGSGEFEFGNLKSLTFEEVFSSDLEE